MRVTSFKIIDWIKIWKITQKNLSLEGDAFLEILKSHKSIVGQLLRMPE